MKTLRILFAPLVSFLKAVLYEWLVSLIRLIRILCERCRIMKRKNDWPARQRLTAKQPCVPISDPAFKRPDPLIYDQYYLMSLGYAVTWDNPDIEVQKEGVTVPSHALDPDTDYELVARIWNNSTEAPIVGLPVQFSFLSFGAGVQSHYIGQTAVNLGVKGGPNHPAFAKVPWKTPAQQGHYCVQVGFQWIDDVNPFNNLGQENTDVGKAHSPAEFKFQLRNNTRKRQKFDLDVDTYGIPPRDPCDQRPNKPGSTAPAPPKPPGAGSTVPPKHKRENYPVPPGWSVVLNPKSPTLDPHEEITVQVSITPPDAFTGRQPFNVNAFHSQGLAGGVTLFVERP